jgi:hypothetical protein
MLLVVVLLLIGCFRVLVVVVRLVKRLRTDRSCEEAC